MLFWVICNLFGWFLCLVLVKVFGVVLKNLVFSRFFGIVVVFMLMKVLCVCGEVLWMVWVSSFLLVLVLLSNSIGVLLVVLWWVWCLIFRLVGLVLMKWLKLYLVWCVCNCEWVEVSLCCMFR